MLFIGSILIAWVGLPALFVVTLGDYVRPPVHVVPFFGGAIGGVAWRTTSFAG